MYALRAAEVVSQGRDHASVAFNSVDWALGSLPAAAARLSVRGHLAALGMRSSAFGHPLLVRGFDATAFYVASAPERSSEGAQAV